MISCTIDTKEGRDVATFDIPGAFMQVDMDEVVHMRLEGTMADLVVKLSPKTYEKYITYEGNKRVLYVQLKKALYGTLCASLLFWKRLTEVLKGWGFVVNPNNQCVANKIVNGKQCTILWHVDDLKISHHDPEVVSSIIAQLETEFGKEAPLSITRGKVHDYVGIGIDYTSTGKVNITMIPYIETMLEELPEDMDGVFSTHAGNHLFTLKKEGMKLGEEDCMMLHHNTAKLLFLCKMA
jgi:Reverse transcriptase (RNA-dependent DNA polymerase)